MEFNCKKCLKIFKHGSSLRRHRKRCPGEPIAKKEDIIEVACKLCDKKFRNKGSMYYHTLRYHHENQSDMKQELPKSSSINDHSETNNETKDHDKNGCKVYGLKRLSSAVPYSMLDVYQIKKNFFQPLHSFFTLEEVLTEKEQALVSAVLDAENLEESRNIVNEDLDIFMNILTKSFTW